MNTERTKNETVWAGNTMHDVKGIRVELMAGAQKGGTTQAKIFSIGDNEEGHFVGRANIPLTKEGNTTNLKIARAL